MSDPLLTPLRSRLVPVLLRENRPFRFFFAGQAVSLVGDQITLLALPLVGVLTLDASAAQMGYLATAGLVPNLLFSLFAGAWVDRRGGRRRIMIAADLGRAAVLASINAALVPDRLRSRVSGAYMVVNYGVRPLGALAGGALGSWIGLRPTLWIATVGALAGFLWLLPSPILRLAELPEQDD